MQLYRLMGILVLLLRQERLTIPQLAERFEVSPRTIRRDIESLCKAGVPVSTAQGYGGGVFIAPEYRLEPSLFTKEELGLVLAGVQGMGSVFSPVQAQGVLEKLGGEGAQGEISIDLSAFDPAGLSRQVEVLSAAIREGRLVSFHYFAPSGESLRKVEPHRLLYRLSAWYLLGFCRERQDFRTFKLARITGLETLEEGFSPRTVPPERMDFQAYFRQEGIVLRALFAPEAAYRLVEEYGEGCFSPWGDGRLLLERRFVRYENLREWVLGFGAQAEVLEPPNLREDLRRQAENLLALYGKGTASCPVPDDILEAERKCIIMKVESRCGLLCSQCSYREPMNCPGCVKMDRPFWGESCPVKSCCQEKSFDHCGQCGQFPCELLRQFAYDKQLGDGGKRIETCREWQKEGV